MQTIRYPAELPVSQRREDILAALRAHQVVIVAGETGSGKTTQLPKMCLEAGFGERGVVGCTQPRRVAAMSISRRVAEELQVTWGREVGCKMRFNDDTGRETVLKFMTDGILLAEIQSDPLLRRYSAIILDEAHERSLNIDFLLGYLKGLLPRRRDLKLIITSATIDTGAFSEAFGGAPIIEVSGRLFPVEVRYAPVESFSGEHEDDIGFIEAAARAVEEALIESTDGDILVFLPTERDIRDARDLLEGGLGSGYEVLPLYGRMAGTEQQRVFAPGGKRRIILATNIAETSLTLPRIRYVIDAGLVRMSRYVPRTRTKRLPIEGISQSSANQRAGRAGRVRDGVCIRLYSEEEFSKRPPFTQPEIQRANLAEVILRMKAFRLGDMATFPFLNPPVPAAIRAGYSLLHELGAIDETEELTPLGRDLARLPVDPLLGRMLLQAREEGALPEVLVIAAGLSVPDPRERPEGAKEQAAQCHRAFAVPHSDFLTLLRLWRALPAGDGGGNRNALRRFCRNNFLSFLRMTEWRDIHRQLCDAMSGDEEARIPALSREVNDDAVHRSVLAGLLGHIGVRDSRNVYKASGDRLVTLFPGSHVYERSPRRGDEKTGAKSSQPQWIVAGEIVQTSQLFARTVARIDPGWIERIAPQLCEHRFSEPRWEEKSGRVVATERVLVHGLEIRRGQIDYGRLQPQAATEIFIRHALLEPGGPVTHRFVEENLRLCSRLKAALARSRTNRLWSVEEALFEFYAQRLEKVSSVHDLNKLVRSRVAAEPGFLVAAEADLAGPSADADALAQFPEQVELGRSVLPVEYVYNPGSEDHGVTVQVPLALAGVLTSGQVQWMVPGLREELAGVLLRALPKPLRRALQPLEAKIKLIAGEFTPGRGEFLEELAAFITGHFRVRVTAADWPSGSLPSHLQPRVAVVDHNNQTIATTRDLGLIRNEAEKRDVRSRAWDHTAGQWEQPAVSSWSFGDLPESIPVEEVGGLPVFAHPGLVDRDGEVDVRLFRKAAEAAAATPAGVRRLAEKVLGREVAWLRKEVRCLTVAVPVKKPATLQDALTAAGAKLTAPGGAPGWTNDVLQTTAAEHILRHALRLDPVHPLRAERFREMTEAARRDFPILIHTVREAVKQVFELREKILQSPRRYPGMDLDAHRLVPPDFLVRTPHAQLRHLTRYLKAVLIRGERAALQPAKDGDKARLLLPYADWEKSVAPDNAEAFRWLLEEYRVSLFAQELGTAVPVSPKRLEALMRPRPA
jgi:ATP-dependent helicase HrpA